MVESLLDKARRLQQVSGEVKAVRSALDNARRLQNRASELRKALAEPDLAAQTWRACADAGVHDLRRPDHASLMKAVENLRRGLDVGEASADLDASFDTVKRALMAVAQQTDSIIAEAWPRFASHKAEEAGISAVRTLPPSVRQTLASAIGEVERARSEVPRNPSQVQIFLRRIAWLREEIAEVGGPELPVQLEPVIEALNAGGIPLREMTAAQFDLLREHGFADDLVVRWKA